MSEEREMAQRMGLSTAREFKELKRRQWRAVMAAMDEYALGCAASPAYSMFDDVHKAARRIEQLQSIKEWGR